MGVFLAALASAVPAAEAATDRLESAATQGFTGTYSRLNVFANDCAIDAGIVGREPVEAGRFPVFIYLTGTGGVYNGSEPTVFVERMAARGFVAASVEYESLLGVGPHALDAKSGCVFGGQLPHSAVAQLCARTRADCTQGILVAGFSQGAYIAVRSQNHEPRVRAVYALGLNDTVVPPDHFAVTSPPPAGIRSLPSSRLRIVNGSGFSDEAGDQEVMRQQLNVVTDSSCSLATNSCLRADGSGWYLVQDPQVADGDADHCYFHGGGACSFAPAFDTGWLASSGEPWTLGASLDWLTAKLAEPPLPPSVNGLRAVYFDNPDLTAPMLSRIDPTVDFEWGSAAPDPAIWKDSFSVRWTGRLQAPTTETYKIATRVDDGVRLWLDGRLLIDEWAERFPGESTASVQLTAGRQYDLRLEYFENSGDAQARLLWSSPTIAKHAITRPWLFPGPEQPLTGPGGGMRPSAGAGARLRVARRLTIRGRRVPIRLTCALACEGTLTVKTRRGRYATGRQVRMPAGTRRLLVPVHRVVLRRARRRSVRLRAVARVYQGDVRLTRARSFRLRVRR